ncbi:conserved hypothetical protein [Aspergillus terreus NIH2624]|uniref:LYR family protein n=1 Tax=Aspergillus terreus (strain NIH 2624 / FGSC A1156) TaxID=341663 RepID=Q0CC15_ASPTN|nr:uncharacterized protein ATEG_08769 [Aspergillus terreus NIH2624]EAU30901.1 conserved hypothetical protein [Aspergillus terreus NIH2624]
MSMTVPRNTSFQVRSLDGLQNLRMMKRQTVISQFYQMDKLVVEGQKTGKETGEEGGIVRQKDTGIDQRYSRLLFSGYRNAIECFVVTVSYSLYHVTVPIHRIATQLSIDFAPSRRRRIAPISPIYVKSAVYLILLPPKGPVTRLLALFPNCVVEEDGKASCLSPCRRRSSRSGRQFGDGANRTRTGQIDHDVFEGLPVRRWTRQTQTVSQMPKSEESESIMQGPGGKQTIPEHPMPRDSHLLTPTSRALLRAARAGCIYIRPAVKDPEDEEKETTDVEEQPVIQSAERSFVTRKWTTVPKHLEPPEVEFLAKRRPRVALLPMRRTRFKKVDPATGNISIYEAWVPEGHKIEGEVTDDAQLAAESSQATVIPEAPAPGTVIEGVGVVNGEGVVVAEAGSAAVMTPPKRRPPPPKRKAKGFGKGRRKKVMFAPGEGADASLVHGAGPGGTDGTTEGYAKDGDASQMSADQPGQDDEDDDGEEGDESDEGEESMLDAKTPETPVQPSSVEPAADGVSESAAEQTPASMADALADPKLSETPSQMPPPVPEDAGQPAGEATATPADTTEQKDIPQDVEMTESKPDEKAADVTTSVSDATQSAVDQAAPAPTQETPQPDSSALPTENQESAAVESAEDTTAVEKIEPAPQAEVQLEDAMDTSADQSQAPPEKAPEMEPTQEESKDVDMLDMLEASLNKPVEATQDDKAEKQDEPQAEPEAPMGAPADAEADEQSVQPSPVPAEVPAEGVEQPQDQPTSEQGPDATAEQKAAESSTEPITAPAPAEPIEQPSEQVESAAEPAGEASPEKTPDQPEKPPAEQDTSQEAPSAPIPPTEPSETERTERPAQSSAELPTEDAVPIGSDPEPAQAPKSASPAPQEDTPAQPTEGNGNDNSAEPPAPSTEAIPEQEKSKDAEPKTADSASASAEPAPAPAPSETNSA